MTPKEVILTLEYDFLDCEVDEVRDCIQKCDDEDYDEVYRAVMGYCEHVGASMRKRHDVPPDVREMVEKLRACAEELCQFVRLIYEENVGEES